MKKVIAIVALTMSVMTGCVNTELNEEITTEELQYVDKDELGTIGNSGGENDDEDYN